MKLTHALVALLLPIHLLAQDSTKQKNTELGIFTEGYNSPYHTGESISTLGLTYKHHTNDFVALVLTAGHTTYRKEPLSINQPLNFDTLTWRNMRTKASLGTIGAAVEAQRKFYKRYSLFAGIELRLAFGGGKQDTVITTRYWGPSNYVGGPSQILIMDTRTLPGADVSMMQGTILPYIGIKANFGRFNVGYMLTSHMFSFQHQSIGTHSYGIFDFGLGNTAQRLFATYRF